MFSIIVCSIDPDSAATLKKSIEATATMPFEVIVFDNRAIGDGICQVYNHCAAQAKYDMLCFVHEDIIFHSVGWDKVLAQKLSEADCGVIGFAGGTTKYPYLYGWQSIRPFTRKHYLKGTKGKKPSLRCSKSFLDYSQVVTLDGMCLCVRRDIWQKHNFDSTTFTGFHSYDTDFTTSIFVGGYKNYVCNRVEVEHLSTGSFSVSWLESVKLYINKWSAKLPLFVESEHPYQLIKDKSVAVEAFALRQLFKNRLLSNDMAWQALNDFHRRHPYSLRTLSLLLTLLKR